MVAKAKTDFVDGADVTQSPDGWDWETVSEGAPTKVVFETPGEAFIGQFQGARHIDREPNAKGEDQSFDMYVFRGRDGEMYSLPQSYSLAEAIEDMDEPFGTWMRITYLKDVPTARGQNPMKDFRVDVRK